MLTMTNHVGVEKRKVVNLLTELFAIKCRKVYTSAKIILLQWTTILVYKYQKKYSVYKHNKLLQKGTKALHVRHNEHPI